MGIQLYINNGTLIDMKELLGAVPNSRAKKEWDKLQADLKANKEVIEELKEILPSADGYLSVVGHRHMIKETVNDKEEFEKELIDCSSKIRKITAQIKALTEADRLDTK